MIVFLEYLLAAAGLVVGIVFLLCVVVGFIKMTWDTLV